jgi:hypothetical protein
MMRLTDTWLLTKKILVGIVISLVPLAILAGGLWITQRLSRNHTHSAQTSSSTKVVTDAN